MNRKPIVFFCDFGDCIYTSSMISTNHHSLFAFTLGRHWKLSLAELISVFSEENYQTHTETIAIFQIPGYSDEQLQKKFLTLGGSIRIIKILSETDEKRFPTDVIAYIEKQWNKKVDFALGAYEKEYRLSDIGLRIKKTLGERGIPSRLVNQKNENINAASFKKERLSKTGQEYNLIQLSEVSYIGITLACQDIDAYSHRDTDKSRDMVVGMMPPKLVQMMINISWARKDTAIYDPFCGLGTTLIEAANMGITQVYGSDLSRDMVRASRESLEKFVETEKVWQERIRVAGGNPNKDFSDFQSEIFELDARDIKKWIEKIRTNSPMIISEGYLGQVMSPRDITLEKVQSERRNLADIYSKFFVWLSNANYRGNIVMSFPFWNLHGTYSYFTEIYTIIEKSGFMVVPLLPEDFKLNTTKGSLLYRRDSQTVGREIIKITKKGN